MPLTKKHPVLVFLVALFILNLIQATGTGLFDDEAYYWVYSKFPAWGYFDHPPMIALFIKLGYSLFQNELGVRLLIVTSNILTIGIIYLLLPKKNDTVFFTICGSMAILQVGGIIAVPDLPLTFFVALFFLAYRNFCRKMSLLNIAFLGIVMALMLYTKYHAILIIFFTFLSNPRLALKYQAYIAALIGAGLFIPHLYWQYVHEFPSVYYHLFERNATSYRVSFSFEYLLGQILIAGPFMGWLILWTAFKHTPRDVFEKSLQYSLAGIYILFFISTIKGRVEANWTVPAFVPLIVLSHQFLLTNIKWRRILIRSLPLTLVFVLAVRIYMVLDIGPLKFVSKDEFHKNRAWADSIYKKTHGLPLVFINSYQFASKYWFYTGVPSFSLNTPTYRRNNYNFWPVEDSLFHKRIAALSPYDFSYFKDSIVTPLGTTGMVVLDTFYSFSKLNVISPRRLEVIDGNMIDCKLGVTAEEAYLKAFQSPAFRSMMIQLVVIDDDRITHRFPTNIKVSAITQTEQYFTARFRVHLPRGKYITKYSLPTSLANEPSLNSSTVRLFVR